MKTIDSSFEITQFKEDDLKLKTFPNQILNLKDSLIECLKDNQGFVGKKNEIIQKLNESFDINKCLNENRSLNENDMKLFFSFLIDNQLIKISTEYLVLRDKIIKKKLDNNELNGFKYSNYYDLERSLTHDFNQFEQSFKRSLLSVIIEEQSTDNGDSYFTIKEKIYSTDFEAIRTNDEAIDFVWGYLKSNSIIKVIV